MKFFKTLMVAATFILAASACNEDALKIKYYPSIEENNTGTLELFCDENLKSIVLQQLEIFELNYPKAKVIPIFLNEKEIVAKLLNGTARTALIAKKLSKAELKQIEKIDTIKAREHYIAKSALALAVNKSATKVISEEALKSLFTEGKKNIIVEGRDGLRLLALCKMLGIDNFGQNIAAVSTLDSVLAYVEQNKNVLGLIDYAHISDEFSAKTEAIFSQVSFLKVKTFCDDTTQLVSANPGDIFTECYPLVTTLNYVVTDYRNKLSLGLATFLIKPKSARIFIHAGFIPEIMPQREILIDTSAIEP